MFVRGHPTIPSFNLYLDVAQNGNLAWADDSCLKSILIMMETSQMRSGQYLNVDATVLCRGANVALL